MDSVVYCKVKKFMSENDVEIFIHGFMKAG